jgi:hypothetical protein
VIGWGSDEPLFGPLCARLAFHISTQPIVTTDKQAFAQFRIYKSFTWGLTDFQLHIPVI